MSHLESEAPLVQLMAGTPQFGRRPKAVLPFTYKKNDT